jgi:hypothetical protein
MNAMATLALIAGWPAIVLAVPSLRCRELRMMGGLPPPAWAPPAVLELASQRLGKRFEKERCAKLWGSLVTAFGDDTLAMRALQRTR